jgi:hypothetical protein
MPDWILARPGGPLLLLELKSETGRLDKAQQRWLELVSQTMGVDAEVVRPRDADRLRALLEGRAA